MKSDASRVDILSRIAAAAVGGYALSSATAICLSLVLPMARSEAVLTATMVSFVVYVCVALWAFSASSVGRVWAGLTLSTALLCVPLLILRLGGAL
ncbi:DUF3649 domain-containing protein [Pelagibius sp.]|uniref:DUF3649 domain-containing protein n=1 Tax=Pelagibius sp. TaxID=1931238 RepID=UPI003C7CF4F5